MPLRTTTIGAYPKPDYVQVPDWFRNRGRGRGTEAYTEFMRDADAAVEDSLVRATQEIVREQVEAGIDIPSEGEIRRDNYIYYHCRHLDGFDFDNLIEKAMRNGAWTELVPQVAGPIRAGAAFLPQDWRIAQAVTDRPVKITVPGTLTVTDSVADRHYGDARKLAAELADALNRELHALAEAGCRWIQIDEPLFARWPDQALDHGIENLERAFHGLPESVTRAVHICCGYPDHLDQADYVKADGSAYFTLADALEDTSIQAVSIEDAHRHNDLSLLERFASKAVIFGVIAIARSRVETVAEIEARLRAALAHIDADRLIAAPDCGLGFLPRETVRAKLANMTAAAKQVG